MARASQSFASKVNDWKLMVAGYKKHVTDLSFAKNEAGELEALIPKVEGLDVKQEQIKAELSKITAEIDSTVKQGDKLSASIYRYAKGKYGPKSPEIKDFK